MERKYHRHSGAAFPSQNHSLVSGQYSEMLASWQYHSSSTSSTPSHFSSSPSSIRLLPSLGSLKITSPPRGSRAMGCSSFIFRGNYRLLCLAGTLILTCYLITELVLRSWTLEDLSSSAASFSSASGVAPWSPDCLHSHSVNPDHPSAIICDQAKALQKSQPSSDLLSGSDDRLGGTQEEEIVSIDKPIIRGNGNEIIVDRAELQAIKRKKTPARAGIPKDHRYSLGVSVTHEKGSNTRGGMVRIVKTKGVVALGGESPNNYHHLNTKKLKVNMYKKLDQNMRGKNVSKQDSSSWTLLEDGSKNGSHVQFINSDVLQYRNSLLEKEQGQESSNTSSQQALEQMFYVRHPQKINPHEFTLIYNASGVCSINPFLVIIIPSLPTSRERRNAIRETWGSVSHSSYWPNEEKIQEIVKIAFLLGKTESHQTRESIEKESKLYSDIVQEDFLESYRNLSLKSVMGLKWVVNFCSGAKYMMKCDDDMIAHIPMILKLLRMSKYQNTIIGHINKGAVVQRQGLWGLLPEEFPLDHFPPYASGTAYIISGDIIRPLFQMSEHVPIVPIEDAYVTGVLAKIVGANHIHQNGFTSWNAFSPRTCDVILGRIFTGTKMTSNSLRRMWKRIKGGGPNCSRDAPSIVMARMNRNERR